MITVVGDRESDILEIFERVPDSKTHLIVRASHDRILETDEKISELLENTIVCGMHSIELPRISNQRKARVATLAIKHTPITLRNSQGEELNIFCVHAMEVSVVPAGETPISWVLLSTHLVSSLKDAIQILTWYTLRWIIEQIFRTMKNKGLKLEDSQIEDQKKLQVLSILCAATAIKIMSLVESRDGKHNRNAIDLFTDEELILLALICKKLKGKTKKQKNPYIKRRMSWASWVLARLGDWNGYRSEGRQDQVLCCGDYKNLSFNMRVGSWLNKMCASDRY